MELEQEKEKVAARERQSQAELEHAKKQVAATRKSLEEEKENLFENFRSKDAEGRAATQEILRIEREQMAKTAKDERAKLEKDTAEEEKKLAERTA